MTRHADTYALGQLVDAMRYALRWLEYRTFSQHDDLCVARLVFAACMDYQGPDYQGPLAPAPRERALLRLAGDVLDVQRQALLPTARDARRAALSDAVRRALLGFDDIEPCHDTDRAEWRARVEAAAVPVGARI